MQRRGRKKREKERNKREEKAFNISVKFGPFGSACRGLDGEGRVDQRHEEELLLQNPAGNTDTAACHLGCGEESGRDDQRARSETLRSHKHAVTRHDTLLKFH